MIKRIIILVAAFLGLISTFLPWAVVSVSALGQSVSESVNGTEGDGWITLVLFVAIAALAVVSGLKDFKKEMPIWAKIAISAVAVICAVIAVIDMGNVANTGIGATMSLLGASASVNVGIGLILIVLMAVVSGVVAWLPLEKWVKLPAAQAVAPVAATSAVPVASAAQTTAPVVQATSEAAPATQTAGEAATSAGSAEQATADADQAKEAAAADEQAKAAAPAEQAKVEGGQAAAGEAKADEGQK